MNQQSSEYNRILAFAERILRVFAGRRDVYAVKREKDGRKFYFPKCNNFWKSGVCLKRSLKEAGESAAGACQKCEDKDYDRLTSQVVLWHLYGRMSIGTYLLLPDGTCRAAAIDLDGHGRPEDEDEPILLAARIIAAAEQLGIHAFLERSGGGHGAHIWLFFDKPIPGILARRLLSGLLVKAGVPDPLKREVFPKQNELKEAGLGNLIAMPLQGPEKIEAGCSVFLDPDSFEVVHPQGRVLSEIEASRHTLHEVKDSIVELEKLGVYRRLRMPRSGREKRRRNKKGFEELEGRSEAPIVDDPIGAVYDGCAALREIKMKAEGKLSSDSQHGIGHAERLALAGALRKLPGGEKEIHRLLSCCEDYNEETTTLQIESLKKPPWLCETLVSYGLCSGICTKIRKREGRSPVAFAYRSASKAGIRGKKGKRPQKSATERFLEKFGE